MADPTLWTQWQLADSAFPAGGFAHAAGLEAAWKAGFIPDEAALVAALHAVLRQTAAGTLPLLRAAVDPAADLVAFERLNARAESSLLSDVARDASHRQGEALAAAGRRVFAGLPAGLFAAERAPDDDAPSPPLHLGPTFGRLAAALGLTPEAAAELFLFAALRGALSAAVRLGLTGPLRSQALLQQLGPHARRAAAEAGCHPDDVAQPAPLLELLQAQQGRLYSRLFQS